MQSLIGSLLKSTTQNEVLFSRLKVLTKVHICSCTHMVDFLKPNHIYEYVALVARQLTVFIGTTQQSYVGEECVTGFWKTYQLHTNEIIRISDFAFHGSKLHASFFSAIILVIEILLAYRIAQNFGGKKLWRIWRFATDPPKFYPPTIFILQPFYCARQPIRQCFVRKNVYWHQSAKVFNCQSFVLYGISNIICLEGL